MPPNMKNNWGMDKLSFWQQQYLFNQEPIKSPSFPQYWQFTPQSKMQEDGIHRAYNSNSPSLVQHHIPPHNPNAGVQHIMQSMRPDQQQTGFLSKTWDFLSQTFDVYDFCDEVEKRVAQNEFHLAGSGASTGSYSQHPQKRAEAYSEAGSTRVPAAISGDCTSKIIFSQAPLDVKSAYYRAATLLSIAYGMTGDASLREWAQLAIQSGDNTWRSQAGGSSSSVEIQSIMRKAFSRIPEGVKSDFNIYPYNIWWTMEDIEATQVQHADRNPFNPLTPDTGLEYDEDPKKGLPWGWIIGGGALVAWMISRR